MRATARGWVGGVLLAVVAAAGCGGDEPEASPTMRRIGGGDAEAASPPSSGPDIDAWMEAAEAEVADAAPSGPSDRPPRVEGLQIQPAEEINGRDVKVRAFASDPDGDEVEISYEWLVNGDEVEAEGAVFRTAGLSSGDTVQVRVMASAGGRDSEPVEGPLLRVVNAPPVILTEPIGAEPGGGFRYQVQAEDPDGDPNLRYSLAEAPKGMSISKLGGLVEWQPGPDTSGVHTIDIVVTDARGANAHQRFDITLTPPGSPDY